MNSAQTDSIATGSPNNLAASHSYVETVLGRSFIAPSEVATQFGFVYTDSQLSDLYATLVADDVTLKLLAAGCVLIPCPPTDMDIYEVLYLASPASERQPMQFAERLRLTGGSWLAIRQPVEASASHSTSLLNERMLTVAEAVYGATVCHILRGVNLIGSEHVMTSTVLKNGCRAHVAYPEAKSFVITGIWNNDRYDYLSGLTF